MFMLGGARLGVQRSVSEPTGPESAVSARDDEVDQGRV